jgi:hypothetical protein
MKDFVNYLAVPVDITISGYQNVVNVDEEFSGYQLVRGLKIWFMVWQKVDGALLSPKGITLGLCIPNGVLNTAFHRSK